MDERKDCCYGVIIQLLGSTRPHRDDIQGDVDKLATFTHDYLHLAARPVSAWE